MGGLIAGALERAGNETIVVARPSTARVINERGLHVTSVRLGSFVAHPRAVECLQEPADALIVSPKATALAQALERIEIVPPLLLALLNGLDHIALLRDRFAGDTRVVAGAIRVESDRPTAATIVHTSPFLRIDMACAEPTARDGMELLAQALNEAEIPARILDSEAQVMWGKLVRLNALACTTSAHDKLLGEIRSTQRLRAELYGAIREACEVAVREGAQIEPESAIAELQDAHATLGSSMQRDIAAGRAPELDAIPGAVLRAAARHGIACPTIERLVGLIAARAGVPAPAVSQRASGLT